jgi:hypothetical protein
LSRLAKFPRPEVCRHHVGLLILDELAQAHPEVENDSRFVQLVNALGSNSEGDETVITLCRGGT